MAFTDHKITNFTHRLSDLPDQPNLSAAELKAYFDSSPEELRQALNGVCADADRLDDRVSGIVAGTFGDTIPKAMLSHELQAELNAKAEEAAVAARLAAEQAARESADTALRTHVETGLAQKCEAYFGIYQGDGEESKYIELGFQPKAVMVFSTNGYVSSPNSYQGGLAFPGHPCGYGDNFQYRILDVTGTGFTVYKNNSYIYANAVGSHYYVAFK